jgi:hypothetical protein
MNTDDDYTPNPSATTDEHMGATEDNEWTPVRVPGSDQGTADADKPQGAAQPGVTQEGADAEDEMDAYDETTGG